MSTLKAAPFITDMPTGDTITDEVKAKLVEIFGEQDAESLAAKRPFEIRTEFGAELNTAFWGQDTLTYVVAMLNRLQANGFGHQAPPAWGSSGPIEVTVRQEKPLGDRSLSELLQLLVDKQGDPRRILEAFKADGDVSKALGKTQAIIIPAADGGVNIPETVAYINRLARPFGQSSHKVGGAFPVTIAQAFDTENKVIINFVTGRPTYVGEPDEFGLGLVFSELDDKIIKAGLWGVLTGHTHAFSSDNPAEQEEFLEQLFQDNLPRRMKRVIEDYERAVSSGDPEAQSIVYLLSEEKALELIGRLGGGTTSSAPKAHDEAYYAELVRRHAALSPLVLTLNGHDQRKNGGVYSRLKVNGHDHRVANTIILDSGSVNGFDHKIEVIMPPGRDLSVNGHNHDVRVTNMTWKRIAEHLGLS